MEGQINTKAFGKNDIRGIFPSEVNGEVFFYAAKGYVKFVLEEFKKKDNSKSARELLFAVCMDARTHSEELKRAIIQGINSTGADTLDLGLAPTPLGYFAEFAKIDNEILKGKKVNGSLIITASHNPSEYNGLKMTFNKQSLSEEQIKEVKKYTIEAKENSGYSQVIKGVNIKYDIISNYQNKIEDMFGSIGKYNGRKIKVVVDSANATAGIVAPQLYRDLGCDVIELYSQPDGTFPNHHPNPSDIKTLDDIRKKVKEEGADLGIAFDGDADRIGAIDEEGNIITGDKLLLIYAQDLIKTLSIHGEVPIIVSEVKCSQVLYDTIEKLGAKAIMTKTGHGYIKSKMKETGAILAGESALNPQTENGIYKGLFQLASLGLVDAKKWAQENKDVPGMKNINPKLTIKQFQKLDGEAQLDYLIAYIGKSKEYSKIGADEQITPGQLWAMIKYPFKGKNKGLINAKTDSIQNVFKNSKIAHGAIQ